MKIQARVAAAVRAGLIIVAAAVAVVHVLPALEQVTRESQASMSADAALRGAARALAGGITDGSATWNSATHTASSAGFSAGSPVLVSAYFDVWTSTFCVSASNGHRITNASHGIERGTCVRPTTLTPTPSQATTASTGGAPPGWVRPCVNADLQLALAPDVSPMTGEHAVIYSLTNRATTQCILFGFPVVAFHDLAGNVLPFQYAHSGSAYVPVLQPTRFKLRPGESAFFIAAQYRCDQGAVMTAATISVKLPNAATSAAVRPALIASRPGGTQLDYCNGGAKDLGNVMAISPMTADITSLQPK